MKLPRIFALAMTVLTFFGAVACKKQTTYNTSPEFNFETDFQHYCADDFMYSLAETESGFYYIEGNHLRYIDKITMQDITLCSKPECTVPHEELASHGGDDFESCNAYVVADSRSIFAYRGDIYFVAEDVTWEDVSVSRSYVLVRMSPDGTNRKVIWEMEIEDGVNLPALRNILFHRGNLFYVVGDANDQNHTIYRCNLDTKKVQKIVKCHKLNNMAALGDHLFLTTLESAETRSLLRYTLSTGEMTPLPEGI